MSSTSSSHFISLPKLRSVIMYLNEAREFLSICNRTEVRDHTYGEREVTWVVNGKVVGGGSFGKQCIVWINLEDEHALYFGLEAVELSFFGELTKVVFA